MEVIIFIIIIWSIFAKSAKNTNTSIEAKLAKLDFTNIKKISVSTLSIYYTAIKNGENYLISYSLKREMLDTTDVDSLYVKMESMHFHNGLLIGLYRVPEDVRKYGLQYGIEVAAIGNLNVEYMNRKYNIIKTNENINVVKTKKDYTNYNNFEGSSDSPIKEKTKGTSILSNLFKKPDRL